MFHKLLSGLNIHVPFTWEYADAAARTGATGFVAADVGKLARQLDNNTFWVLVATAPTWVALSASGKENAVIMQTAVPTVNDDNTQGYIVTDLWFYDSKIYVLLDATTGAAKWRQLSGKHVLKAAAPTVTDDSSAGYAIEDIWVNETTGTAYVCKTNGVGTATWVQIAGDHNVLSNRSSANQHPISAITDLQTALNAKQTKLWVKLAMPTATDDLAAGYLVTDEWYYDQRVWVCTDNTNGAAVWKMIGGDMLSPSLYSEVAVTGAAVLTSSAYGKMHNCTTLTAYTITLPTAVGYTGQSIGFRFGSSNAFIVTLDGNGAELIGTKLTRPYVHDEQVVLRSDGANWVIISEYLIPVGCAATKAAVQSVPTGAWTKINLDTESYDNDNCFDPVTDYRFLPKAPGYYMVDVQATFLLVGTGNQIGIAVNYSPIGQFILNQNAYAGVATRTLNSSWTFYFNGTTDFLEMRVYHAQGANRDIQTPLLQIRRLSNV